jgi:hypothetical protein
MFSQSNENKDAYVLFDAIVGQKNLEINVGVKYFEKYRTLKNEHQFFNDKKLKEGIVSFNHQVYYNVPLMYDVYQDALIINITSKYDSYLLILDKKKVDYFVVDGFTFNNVKGKGYLQVLATKHKTELYKKNQKKVKSRFVEFKKFSRFISNNSFEVFNGVQHIIVNGKNDWIKAFPSLKSSIQFFFKSNKVLLKNDPDSFMINLFKTLTK